MNTAQVDHGFDEDHLEEGCSTTGAKRGRQALAAGPAGAIAKRQLAWITRDEHTVQDQAWRPIQLHRVAARKFLLRLDNQLRTSTTWPGLVLH